MRADGAATRQSLIEAGERLFATRGLDVPLSEVQRAAGQRNKSALHYHFGGRDGLLQAILDQHLGEIERRRAAMVAAASADDRHPTLDDDVRALVVPLAEQLRTPRGRRYLLLLPQVVHLMGLRTAEPVLPPGLEQAVEGMRAHLRGMPDDEVNERLATATVMNAGAMADRARQVEAGLDLLLDHDAYVEMLVGMLTRAIAP